MKTYSNIEQLRSYSTIFSSTSFLRLIQKNDYSFLDKKIERFDSNFQDNNKTYRSYIRYIYNILQKEYRCEYIYKNSLINELIKDKYQFKSSIAINEFRVGKSIVDLAIFNGLSKAFEIKTELDSSKRLESQLTDYKQLFNKCYIITHESLGDKYLELDKDVGIVILNHRGGNLGLEEIRPARLNKKISSEIAIRSLQTKEYKNIIKQYFGKLPEVNSFEMFNTCLSMMKEISSEDLNKLFLQEIKKRILHKKTLNQCQRELKTICLSLNLDQESLKYLNEKLNQYI